MQCTTTHSCAIATPRASLRAHSVSGGDIILLPTVQWCSMQGGAAGGVGGGGGAAAGAQPAGAAAAAAGANWTAVDNANHLLDILSTAPNKDVFIDECKKRGWSSFD